MPQVDLVTQGSATGDAKSLLEQINKAFGATPNMFRAVANSPAALKSMWGAFGALGAGTLGAKLGEQIAVAVADRNNCSYCLAAHTVLGKKAAPPPRKWRMPELAARRTRRRRRRSASR